MCNRRFVKIVKPVASLKGKPNVVQTSNYVSNIKERNRISKWFKSLFSKLIRMLKKRKV